MPAAPRLRCAPAAPRAASHDTPPEQQQQQQQQQQQREELASTVPQAVVGPAGASEPGVPWWRPTSLAKSLLLVVLGVPLWLLAACVEALRFLRGPRQYLQWRPHVPPPALPPGLERITLQANGISFFGVRAGGGQRRPLMLLLHGWPETWACWRHQLAEFEQAGYEVVAVNMRGFHPTSAPRGKQQYRLDVLAGDVAALVRKLNEEGGSPSDRPAIVIGHDWGGIAAWAAALAHPEAIQRLVVMCAPMPGLPGADLRQWLRLWYVLLFRCPLPLPELLLRARDCQRVQQLLSEKGVGGPLRPGAVDADAIEWSKVAMAHPGGAGATLSYYRAIGLPFSRLGERVRVPTLLIWGDQDAALGPQLAYGATRLVDDVTLRMLRDCSHWAPWEQPKEVNAITLEWLQANGVS